MSSMKWLIGSLAGMAFICFFGHARAQLSYSGLCRATVCVAFEPLPVAHHAVLIVNGQGRLWAFEANSTGALSGALWVRFRNLSVHPLVAGSEIENVSDALAPASYYVSRIEVLSEEVNNSHLPYAPVPALWPTAANSNTFVFSVLVHLGLRPPPPPEVTPGYYNALTDWQH